MSAGSPTRCQLDVVNGDVEQEAVWLCFFFFRHVRNLGHLELIPRPWTRGLDSEESSLAQLALQTCT